LPQTPRNAVPITTAQETPSAKDSDAVLDVVTTVNVPTTSTASILNVFLEDVQSVSTTETADITEDASKDDVIKISLLDVIKEKNSLLVGPLVNLRALILILSVPFVVLAGANAFEDSFVIVSVVVFLVNSADLRRELIPERRESD